MEARLKSPHYLFGTNSLSFRLAKQSKCVQYLLHGVRHSKSIRIGARWVNDDRYCLSFGHTSSSHRRLMIRGGPTGVPSCQTAPFGPLLITNPQFHPVLCLKSISIKYLCK